MENVTIFVDNVGRMIVGAVNDKVSNKSIFAVDNPAVVNIQADPDSGNISVQLLPFVFSEFVIDAGKPTTWEFTRSSVVISNNIELDNRIVQQYDQIVNQQPTQQAPAPAAVQPNAEPEVIKLFDE
jgi:hypothetical protein